MSIVSDPGSWKGYEHIPTPSELLASVYGYMPFGRSYRRSYRRRRVPFSRRPLVRSRFWKGAFRRAGAFAAARRRGASWQRFFARRPALRVSGRLGNWSGLRRALARNIRR